MIEGILYVLTELLLLRGLVAHISHQPAMLHDSLLESSEHPADAVLCDAKAEHSCAVWAEGVTPQKK